MANAWGSSWGVSWGVSWGSGVVPRNQGDDGGDVSRPRRGLRVRNLIEKPVWKEPEVRRKVTVKAVEKASELLAKVLDIPQPEARKAIEAPKFVWIIPSPDPMQAVIEELVARAILRKQQQMDDDEAVEILLLS